MYRNTQSTSESCMSVTSRSERVLWRVSSEAVWFALTLTYGSVMIVSVLVHMFIIPSAGNTTTQRSFLTPVVSEAKPNLLSRGLTLPPNKEALLYWPWLCCKIYKRPQKEAVMSVLHPQTKQLYLLTHFSARQVIWGRKSGTAVILHLQHRLSLTRKPLKIY